LAVALTTRLLQTANLLQTGIDDLVVAKGAEALRNLIESQIRPAPPVGLADYR